MGHFCKGICKSHRFDYGSNRGRPKYMEDKKIKHKKCNVCAVRLYNLPKEMKYCPCCGLQLNNRTTYVRYKKIKQEQRIANSITKTITTAEGYEILLMIDA